MIPVRERYLLRAVSFKGTDLFMGGRLHLAIFALVLVNISGLEYKALQKLRHGQPVKTCTGHCYFGHYYSKSDQISVSSFLPFLLCYDVLNSMHT